MARQVRLLRVLDRLWLPSDRICQRDRLSLRWLDGQGLEIGALHKPVRVKERVRVRYVDYKSHDENRVRYPELENHAIVTTDIVDDGFVLGSIPDASVNFIVANHALEHSPDPCGTMHTWSAKLRPGGIIFAAVPVADKCYDRGRPITTLQHLLEDHELFQAGNVDAIFHRTQEHVREFTRISARNICQDYGHEVDRDDATARYAEALLADLFAELRARAPTYDHLLGTHIGKLNRLYDVHYHTFSPSSYYRFVLHVARREGMAVVDCRRSGGAECIAILRKPARACAA